MDEITRAVRAQYEAFPYPGHAEGCVADVHPKLLLSYLEKGGPPSRGAAGGDSEGGGPLEILDAGCGTGTNCLGTALCNPTAQVTAVDVNRVALERVREQAARMNLKNLRVVELDLMQLHQLPSPERGYDVIISAGVLHHLSRPAEALAQLASLLHPQGAMRMMVYNRLGRQDYYRFVQALDGICPRSVDLAERLRQGRALMDHLLPGTPASDPSPISDVEFVDRYLHFNDQSYNVPELLELTGQAGLKLLRWHEPRDWRAESVQKPPLEGRWQQGSPLDELSGPALWSAIELLGQRRQLDAIFCHGGASPRGAQDAPGPRVAISPQVTWLSGRRLGGETLFTFVSSVVVREGPERVLTAIEVAAAREQWEPDAALTLTRKDEIERVASARLG